MVLPFVHPSTILIAGPSKAGKSIFVDRLLKHQHEMFSERFQSITWCYGSVIPNLSSINYNIQFIQGLPDMETFNPPSPGLIIVDDLMAESGQVVADLFTKYSHHKNLTVIFIVQNLFYKGKCMRDISLNSHYIVCFKNPRDKLQIQCLARQIMPSASKQLVSAFQDATQNPHSYLLFDMTQSIPDALRLRTNIFPDEQLTVYTLQKYSMQTFNI